MDMRFYIGSILIWLLICTLNYAVFYAMEETAYTKEIQAEAERQERQEHIEWKAKRAAEKEAKYQEHLKWKAQQPKEILKDIEDTVREEFKLKRNTKKD